MILKIFRKKPIQKAETADSETNIDPSILNANGSSGLAQIDLSGKPNCEESKMETSPSIWKRLNQGLTKTRHKISTELGNLFLGKKEFTEETLEQLEALLLSADVGVSVTEKITKELADIVHRNELKNLECLKDHLKELLLQILLPYEQPLSFDTPTKPFVLLAIGVNGSGKTTTLGKLAYQLKPSYTLMLAACDTFRAAAREQLQIWGDRVGVPVITQNTEDPASIAFDALAKARLDQTKVLAIDTSGRLHTHHNLMEELKKIKRVIQKSDPIYPQETLLILDANNGQNALKQAEQFHQHIGLTGIAFTKLDGTAKGGMIFAIAEKLKLPIRYIGVGEKVEDLQIFRAKEYIDAMFDDA